MSHHEHQYPAPSESGPCLPVAYENLPQELIPYTQWVCWRYVDRGPHRKPDKQPVNPHTIGNAGVGWPNTWSSFEQAFAAYQEHNLAGVGFVLTRNDPFVGVDLDSCVSKDEVTPFAAEVVQALGSYTEYSPSGTGLRILVAAPKYTDNRRTRDMEIYSHSRFLTLTGHHVEGAPHEIATVSEEQITTLVPVAVYDAQPPAASSRERPLENLSDMQLWERIFEHDRYGEQHLRRFQGDTSPDGNDHSLSVLRLLNTLARWTEGDPVKMRYMMLLSPLKNEKWFSRRGKQDWLDYQIQNAISYTRGRK